MGGRGPEIPPPPGPLARAWNQRSTETVRMFARYFIELPLRADVVEDVMMADPEAWLAPIAQRANIRGDHCSPTGDR